MQEREPLLRDIEALGETIRGDWADLASQRLCSSEQARIRKHIAGCVKDVMTLVERLEGNATEH